MKKLLFLLLPFTINAQICIYSNDSLIKKHPKDSTDLGLYSLVIGNGGKGSQNEPASQAKSVFEINSVNGQYQAINVKTYGQTPATQNDIHFTRYDGTPQAPTNTKSGMMLMSWGFRGYGAGSPSQSSVAFQVQASQDWSDAGQGANVIFQTTPNNRTQTSRKSALVINNDQRIFLSKGYSEHNLATNYLPYRNNAVLNVDLISGTSPSSTLVIGALFTHSTNQSTSLIMGSGTTDEGYLYHYGSSMTGSLVGLPFAKSMRLSSPTGVNFIAGTKVCIYPVSGANGAIVSNPSGVFIGAQSSTTVTPQALLHLGTSASETPLKFTIGPKPTNVTDGCMWFDGTHLYISIGGIDKQLDN